MGVDRKGPKHNGPTFRTIQGPIPEEFISEWDALVSELGSPFQTSSFLRVFDKTWAGTRSPCHCLSIQNDRLVGAIPAYIYGDCSTLRQLRGTWETLGCGDSLLMSHAFVAWTGHPLAHRASLQASVDHFSRVADALGCVAFFSAIDARQAETLDALRRGGYFVRQVSTLMVQDLRPLHAGGDVTTRLGHRARARVRNELERARSEGLHIRLGRVEDRLNIVALMRRCHDEMGLPPDHLPSEFVAASLTELAGVETVVAESRDGRIIGVQINLRGSRRYFHWVAGHDHALLKHYHQSHALYEASIARAAALGLSEAQAGRRAYAVKRHHGFDPVPLMAAIRGRTPSQHRRAVAWVEGLSVEHLREYAASSALPTMPGRHEGG